MRLTSAPRRASVLFDAPGFGKRYEVATRLAYGMSIAKDIQSAASSRTFYPMRRTSGEWNVRLEFPDRQGRDAFHSWLLLYINRVVNTKFTPLKPIIVTVPSMGFRKEGYPGSAFDFGDTQGVQVYSSTVSFVSASDSLTAAGMGSQFKLASADATASYFSPAGTQQRGAVGPVAPRLVPTVTDTGDGSEVFDRGGGQPLNSGPQKSMS